jgi:hypothetical protein
MCEVLVLIASTKERKEGRKGRRKGEMEGGRGRRRKGELGRRKDGEGGGKSERERERERERESQENNHIHNFLHQNKIPKNKPSQMCERILQRKSQNT